MELIKLEYLAGLLNDMLGARYSVTVDSRTYVNDKVPCVLQATRVPFAIDSINSETLDIELYLYLNVDNDRIKCEQLAEINNILGSHSGEIVTGESEGNKRFRYHMFLNGNKPVTEPAYDMGFDCASYVVTGTALISDITDGGVMSNDVITEVSDRPFEDADAIQGELAVLNCETDTGNVMENLVILNSSLLVPYVKVHGTTISLSALAMNRPIDELLIDTIYDFNTAKTFYVRRTARDKSITKTMKLINGKVLDQAGAYRQYQLLFQETPNE